jgi:hypothetical protein
LNKLDFKSFFSLLRKNHEFFSNNSFFFLIPLPNLLQFFFHIYSRSLILCNIFFLIIHIVTDRSLIVLHFISYIALIILWQGWKVILFREKLLTLSILHSHLYLLYLIWTQINHWLEMSALLFHDLIFLPYTHSSLNYMIRRLLNWFLSGINVRDICKVRFIIWEFPILKFILALVVINSILIFDYFIV